MMTRIWLKSVPLALAMGVAALLVPVASADAQVVRIVGSDTRNVVNLNVGYFVLRGEDSRDPEDVLLPNLVDFSTRSDLEPLSIGDFNNISFGGEWLYAVSDHLEVGVGADFYQKTVETVYADLVDEDGTEIAQDLKLRIVPLTGTVRFLILGRDAAVEPYVGAGIGIFNWRYSESGEFVDLFDNTIFRASYTATGNAVGPVILGGVRAAVGDASSVGAELRWQSAKGEGLLAEEFLRDRIDLGGLTFRFTVGFRF